MENSSATHISNVKVEMYSTYICPYCMRARQLLEAKGVHYTEIRVDRDRNLRIEMEQRSNRKTVPQIFIDDKHIGGYDELSELELDNELDPLLGLV